MFSDAGLVGCYNGFSSISGFMFDRTNSDIDALCTVVGGGDCVLFRWIESLIPPVMIVSQHHAGACWFLLVDVDLHLIGFTL